MDKSLMRSEFKLAFNLLATLLLVVSANPLHAGSLWKDGVPMNVECLPTSDPRGLATS